MRNLRTPLVVISFLLSFHFANAQHYLTSATYNQNFNTIGFSSTGNDISTLPTGWSFKETGSFINNTYRADHGVEGIGDTYSYGADGTPERAFGSMAWPSTNSKYGITFINTTGKTITALTIGFTSEHWHAGAFNRNDTTLFHYQLGNSLWTENAWTAVPQLNIISNSSVISFQLNGNDPVNQKNFVFVIENISIPVNDTFAFRWTDIDIVSGNDDGVAIDDFSLTAHSEDVFSPHITNLNPSTGAPLTGTTFNGNIHFSEAVKKGTGNIRILNSDNVEVQSIDINDASVIVTGHQVSFSATGLVKEKDYQVLLDSGAIKDHADNNFNGIKNGEWTFNVLSDTDSQRPLIDTLFPTPGWQLATNYVTFRLYLNENIKKGIGKIYIKNSGDQIVQSFSIDSSAITISGNQLYFKSGFLNNGGYYIAIDSGALKDKANNNFGGIAKGRWTFSISPMMGVPIDNHGLAINTRTPAHTSPNVNPTKLEIYWYEYALEQYGFINIRNYYTDSLVQQINVNSAAVTTSANLTTINISPLPAGTYYVDIQPGVFINIPGTEFPGTNKTNWRFTVAGDDHIPLKVVSTDPVNGAINLPGRGRLFLRFNKFIQTSPQIRIKRYSDDVWVETAFTSTRDTMVIMNYGDNSPLQYNTRYYADIAPGLIKDLGGFYTTESSFNKDAWSFTIMPAPLSYTEDFTTCILPYSDRGSTMIANTKGTNLWQCNPSANNNTQGVIMDGNTNNVPAENLDWLIIPSLDLSSMNIVLLKFYSKTEKRGLPLKLMVSTNYTYGTSPGLSTWTQIDGKFPAINSNIWQKSDSIDLSAFKTQNTSIAFQYNSNTDSAAIWSLDDIMIYSSSSIITAVDDIDQTKPHLKIYGNPASNHILAKFSEPVIGKIKVEVINNLGVTVAQKTIASNGLIDIDTKGWKKGMYILKTTYGNKTVTSKVIVQ